MKRQQIENQFIELIEHTLPPEQEAEIRKEIDADPMLRASFKEYRQIVATEQLIQGTTGVLSSSFTTDVMDQIRANPTMVQKSPLPKRFVMQYKAYKKQIIGGLATSGVIAVALLMPRTKEEAGVFPPDKATSEISPDVQSSPPITNSTETTANTTSSVVDSGLKDKTISHEVQAIPSIEKATSNDVRRSERSAALKKAPSSAPATQEEAFSNTNNEAVGNLFEPKRQTPPEAADRAKMTQYPQSQSSKAGAAIEGISGGPSVTGLPAASHQSGRATNSSGTQRSASQNRITANRGSALTEDSERPAGVQRCYHPPVVADVSTVPPIPSFTSTISAPHSTFSMDVDTGSYTNTRKSIRAGRRPDPGSVRPEEFINYFTYTYPEQGDSPFNTVYEIAPSPITKGAKMLRVAVKTRNATTAEKPWNLVFLVDVSGSMAETHRLPLIKQSLKLLASKMRTGDRISIVTYASGARVALPPTGKEELNRINSVIDGLSASGGTNGHAGITLAYQSAQNGFIHGGVNRVILATDGDFNIGITSQSELLQEIQRQRAKNITLTTLGVGEANYKEQLMEQLADKGDGNYFYLDGFDEAQKVFETDLTSTLDVVAKDAKIQVEFNPLAVQSYRLIGYQNRALAAHQFNDDTVDGGEVGAGQSVTALYEVVLVGEDAALPGFVESRYGAVTPTPPSPRPSELGFVRIRFKEPTQEVGQTLSFPVLTQHIQDSLATSSENLRFATAAAAFAEKLQGGAQTISFAEIAALAEGARGSDATGRRAEFLSLVRTVTSMP